jgi:hypothetical protein
MGAAAGAHAATATAAARKCNRRTTHVLVLPLQAVRLVIGRRRVVILVHLVHAE